MARVVHMSVRSRYRLLFVCTVAAFIYLFCPRNDKFSISTASFIQWSTELSKARLPPILKEGSSRFWDSLHPPPPPPQDPKLAKIKKGGKTEKPERIEDDGDVEEHTYNVQMPVEFLESDFFSWKGPDYVPRPKPPYKPSREKGPPVPDPFPLLSRNLKPSKRQYLLRAPKVNRPPARHYPEATPLLIGFTRNWPQLLQCVVSYIAAGWPPQDIYVVENTGVMYANRNGRLTLQNPFYLNHTQLGMLGVNVIMVGGPTGGARRQGFIY